MYSCPWFLYQSFFCIIITNLHHYYKECFRFSFDFIVILLTAVGMLMELININFYYLLVVRPIRLLRSVKLPVKSPCKYAKYFSLILV